MRSFLTTIAARLRRDQRGATAVEYGIMVSLIAVVIIVAVTLLGGTLQDTFKQVQCSVSGGTYAAGATAGKGVCTPKAP
ncbi:pilus assembly protein Flp/PilA [Arthrobacter sp. B3I9]|uniref:Flp family type IVb pilin n=1 Tax=Arthrobacter sp. B3I9 TaxID=3042270 RepID=UPI002794DC24|nr:Flp family type IVb pilin [Arthrobacter sp. B3I9]MDQ0849301.1 pilus assembly protein Flp/PilA [Arthrobacter sp. B3I9]